MKSENDFIDLITVKLIDKRLSTEEKQIVYFFAEQFYTFFENELEPPSSNIALMMSICGNKYPQVVSSTINCFGEKHFCFEDMAEAITSDYKNCSNIYYGFGHPKYKKEDPRVIKLIEFINNVGYKGKYINKTMAFAQKQKVPLNIGGLICAFLLDAGFNKYNISFFPIIIRMIGITKIYEKTKLNNIKFSSSYDAIKRFNQFNQ